MSGTGGKMDLKDKIQIEQFPPPIREALARGKRVELIPVKGGIRPVMVRRDDIKLNKESHP